MTMKFFDWQKEIASGTGDFRGSFALTFGTALQGFVPARHAHVYGSDYKLMCQPSAMLTPGFLGIITEVLRLNLPSFGGAGNVTMNFGRNATANYFGPVLNIRRCPEIAKKSDGWLGLWGKKLDDVMAPQTKGTPEEEQDLSQKAADDAASHAADSKQAADEAATKAEQDEQQAQHSEEQARAAREQAQRRQQAADEAERDATKWEERAREAEEQAQKRPHNREVVERAKRLAELGARTRGLADRKAAAARQAEDAAHQAEDKAQQDQEAAAAAKKHAEELKERAEADDKVSKQAAERAKAAEKAVKDLQDKANQAKDAQETADTARKQAAEARQRADQAQKAAAQAEKEAAAKAQAAARHPAGETEEQIHEATRAAEEARQAADRAKQAAERAEEQARLRQRLAADAAHAAAAKQKAYDEAKKKDAESRRGSGQGHGFSDALHSAGASLTSHYQEHIDSLVGVVVLPISYLLCAIAAAADISIKVAYQTNSYNFPDEEFLENAQEQLTKDFEHPKDPGQKPMSQDDAEKAAKAQAATYHEAQLLYDVSSKTFIPVLSELVLQLEQISGLFALVIGLVQDVRDLIKKAPAAVPESVRTGMNRLKMAADWLFRLLNAVAEIMTFIEVCEELNEGREELAKTHVMGAIGSAFHSA